MRAATAGWAPAQLSDAKNISGSDAAAFQVRN
jgi:hypothetical protein